MGGVKWCGWIMACYPVFDHHGSRRAFDIFMEQDVMADAESHNNIQVSFFFIEYLSLHDWVADIRTMLDKFLWNTYVLLVNSTHLTACRKYLKSMGTENLCQRYGFLQECGTCCDADFFSAHFFGK